MEEVSEAAMSREGIGEPETVVWSPGELIVTRLVTDQLKVALVEYPAPSVAVAVTVLVPAVVGVPVMFPVEALMDKPVGSPVAE